MKEKTVSEAITHRRSVRIYDPEKPIDTEKVKYCIEQATLAATSCGNFTILPARK
jgi:nitroreductase